MHSTYISVHQARPPCIRMAGPQCVGLRAVVPVMHDHMHMRGGCAGVVASSLDRGAT